jgi:hypothetical protein
MKGLIGKVGRVVCLGMAGLAGLVSLQTCIDGRSGPQRYKIDPKAQVNSISFNSRDSSLGQVREAIFGDIYGVEKALIVDAEGNIIFPLVVNGKENINIGVQKQTVYKKRRPGFMGDYTIETIDGKPPAEVHVYGERYKVSFVSQEDSNFSPFPETGGWLVVKNYKGEIKMDGDKPTMSVDKETKERIIKKLKDDGKL